MGAAKMSAATMSREQLFEIVRLAYRDPVVWKGIKDSELEMEERVAEAARQGHDDYHDEARLGPWKHRGAGQLISDVVKRRYGADANFDVLDLFKASLAARRLAREELGLWVDLGFTEDPEPTD